MRLTVGIEDAGFCGRGLVWVGKVYGGFHARKLLPPFFGAQGPVIFGRKSARLCREIRPGGVL